MTYWYGTNKIDEAYFLTAFLNANYPNQLIKTFQTIGLFGPRDIHKRILEVPLTYYQSDTNQIRIAELAKKCESKVETYFKDVKDDYNVGLQRLEARNLLTQELVEIDHYLKKLV